MRLSRRDNTTMKLIRISTSFLFIFLFIIIDIVSASNILYHQTKTLDNGSDHGRFVIHIISSGFDSSHQSEAQTECNEEYTNVFSVNWYKDSKTFFNVYQTITEDPTHGKKLAWNDLYQIANTVNYDYLVIRHNFDAMGQRQYESNALPGWYDNVIEIYNDTGPYVTPHEMAHWLDNNERAEISDEYVGVHTCTGLSKGAYNVHDRNSNEKWSNLVQTDPYEGARFCVSGLWRPQLSCIMRDTLQNHGFCDVCYHALTKGFGKHPKIGTIEDVDPTISNISGITRDGQYSGTLNVTANVSDASGIEKVEFYFGKYDGINWTGEYGQNTVKIDRTNPYTWDLDTTKYVDGRYAVDIFVYDVNWNVTRYMVWFHILNGTQQILGGGCTSAFYIDKDCDGYGVGAGYLLGPDADDNDPQVNTGSTMISKYGSLQNFLQQVKGYNPVRYFFVDPAYGSDNTGAVNLESKPFKTWAAIRTKLQPGDAVIFRKGVLSEKLICTLPALEGTQQDPIILMAYPGESFAVEVAADALPMYDSYHVIVDGLNLRSPQSNGHMIVMANCHDIQIRNVDAGPASAGVYAFQNLHNILIEQSVFHDTNTPPYASHCMYLGSRDLPNSDITIRDSLIYHCGMNAFQHNGRITNLLFERNILHSSSMGAISLLMGVSDSVFRNNLTFNNNQGVIFFNYVSDNPKIQPFDQMNNLFVNNTFWTGRYSYLDGTESSRGPTAYPSVTVNNKIVDGNGVLHPELKKSFDKNIFKNNIFATYSGPIFDFKQPEYLSTWPITDNLMYRYDGVGKILVYGSQVYDFSSFDNFSQLINGNLYGWPEFKDVSVDYWDSAEKFDFRLLANSLAIGLNAGAYISPPPTSLPPQPPSNLRIVTGQ
jgi:hypothetical protein